MTITLELPREEEHKLKAWAAASGKDVDTVIREAIAEKLRTPPATFREILASIHDNFRASGMSETELDILLKETLAEVRKEQLARNSSPPMTFLREMAKISS